MYIAIEGIKGSGKSTLLEKLQQHLQQENIQFGTFSPTRPMPASVWWEQAYPQWASNDAFLSALYTARANYHALQIDFNQPLILGDRSILTSLVTRWHDHQVDLAAYIRQIKQQEYAVPVPDVVLYLDVSLEITRQRLMYRQRHYGLQDESVVRLQQAKRAYTQLFKYKDKLGLKNMKIQYFDANKSQEELFQQVLAYVKNLISVADVECCTV